MHPEARNRWLQLCGIQLLGSPVVSRIMAPNGVHILIPGSHDCVTLHAEGLCDVIKMEDLGTGRVSWMTRVGPVPPGASS